MQTDTIQQPRFRTDLVARTLEENGRRFVDVTDPESGSTFRLYAEEYAIACAMDGSRTLDGIRHWARSELGLDPSAEELGTVVAALSELGYLEKLHPAEPVDRPAGPAAAPGAETAAAQAADPAEEELELAALSSGRGKLALVAVLLAGGLAVVGLARSGGAARSQATGRSPGIAGAPREGDDRAAENPLNPATATLLRTAAPAVELTVPGTARMEFIAADGAAVEKGTVLAQLAGHDRLSQRLASARRRIARHQEALARATDRGEKATLALSRRLDEKKAEAAELERTLDRVVLRAPVQGTFRRAAEIATTAGGQVVGRIEPPTQHTARFILDLAAPVPALGATVRIAAFAEPDRVEDCTVIDSEPGVVAARCPPGVLNPGEQVQLAP
jgi:hypothetical protein